MRWKIALKYSILVFLIAGMAFALYEWLDTAVSLDHARQQQKTERERSEVLRQLVLLCNRGAKRSEIAQFIKQNLGRGHLIKEEEDRILVDNIVFHFDNTQSLSKVQFLDSANE